MYRGAEEDLNTLTYGQNQHFLEKMAKENSGWTWARKGARRARQSSEEQVFQKFTKPSVLLCFQKGVTRVRFTALLILFSGDLGCFWSSSRGAVGWGWMEGEGGEQIYYLWRTSDFFRGLNAFFFSLPPHY